MKAIISATIVIYIDAEDQKAIADAERALDQGIRQLFEDEPYESAKLEKWDFRINHTTFNMGAGVSLINKEG